MDLDFSESIDKKPIVTAEAVEEQVARIPGRDIHYNSSSIALDAVITCLPLYFVIFAILSAVQNRKPADERGSVWLLKAAEFGPTIFPYVFTAIAAKLVKSVATWQLEQGATIGFIECLLGSRSLASSVVTPIRLRILNWFVPGLIILWALSPLGGQSSLRIVTQSPDYNSTLKDFHYLDTRHSALIIDGASSIASFSGSITAAFTSALGGPATSKNGTQDVYSNIQIPMIEFLPNNVLTNSSGWYNTTNATNLIYASMTGIPFLGVIRNTNATFNIETSYLQTSCNMTMNPWKPSNTSAIWGNTTGIFHNGQMSLRDPYTHTSASTTPRKIGFQSLGYKGSSNVLTEAYCFLTTTYVEAEVNCFGSGRNCAVSAIRRSELNHPASELTILDGITNSDPDFPAAIVWASNFWQALVMALGTSHAGTTNPFEYYFVNPRFPYSAAMDQIGFGAPPVGTVGQTLFSQRFAQLLNTFVLAAIAPIAVTGDFSSTPSGVSGNSYAVATVKGTSISQTTVLRCHVVWLVALVITSMIVFAAGLVTAYLDSRRRGPDVFDSFTTNLAHSPFVRVDPGPSMEDADEKARRLRGTVIRLGDVKPHSEVGFVAIATPCADQPVDMLRTSRLYS